VLAGGYLCWQTIGIRGPYGAKETARQGTPYSIFLVWLAVIIVSISFAVDIVGTWEGMLWAGTGIVTCSLTGYR
jgi:hypothetical protein